MAVSGRVVVVDANVLYSIELTDLFLTFAAHRLVRVHWSPTILDEVRRNLAKRVDLTSDAIAYRIDRMNFAVGDSTRTHAALSDIARRRTRPPMNVHELLERLEVVLPNFVSQVRMGLPDLA